MPPEIPSSVQPIASGTGGPWRLPSGWEWVRLGSLCRLVNGRAFKEEDWSDSGLPIIRIQNLNDPTRPFNYFNGECSPRYAVRNGDVLISWSGTPGTSFGAFLWNRGKAILNQHIYRADVDEQRCLRPYFVQAVNLRLDELIRRAQGGVGLRHITKAELEHVPLPFPFPSSPSCSLDTQRKIVDQINALMNEVWEARDIASNIRRDTNRLLAASVDEILNRLRDTSRIVPLKAVATAFNGRASGEGQSPVRVLKTKHIYPHTLRLDRPSFMKPEQVAKLPLDRYLQAGDVLMANIAEGTLGRVTYVENSEQGWTVDTQVMILRSMDPRERLIGKWLYYYLCSARGQKEILSRRSGIAFADKRGQTHIYPKNVLEIPVPVPPISQQTEAVTQLDAVLNQTEEMKRLQDMDSECLDQLEQAILNRAFRGEL